MDSLFNLIDEKWITCIKHDGKHEKISLKEALTNGIEYKEIYHESPLVTVGIHRLLLAILYRIFKVDSFAKSRDLYENGLPIKQINEYLEQWKKRFYLVDDAYPFYQVAGIRMDEGKFVSVNVLVMEAASGHNKTLFDHSMDDKFYCTAPEAARYLIAAQGYGLCGICKKLIYKGEDKKIDQNYFNTALVSGGVIWVSGANLDETLRFNLSPIDTRNNDIPIWENDSSISIIQKTTANGILDLLTFQGRIILLQPELYGSSLLFKKMVYTQGRKLVGLSIDPMMAYKRKVDKKGNDLGLYPVPISEDKSSWRNSNSLFVQETNDHKPPRVFITLSRLRQERLLDSQRELVVNMAGICSDKAKAVLWRHDKIPVLASIFENPLETELLGDLLKISESIARKLESSIYYLCQKYLESENKQADKDDVKKLKDHINPLKTYWFSLEPIFYEILISIDKSSENEIIRNWGKRCLLISLKMLDQAKLMLGNSSRGIIAQAQVSLLIDRDDELLNSLMNEIKERG